MEVYHPVDSSASSTSQTYCDGNYVSSNGTYYCNLKLPGASTAFDNPVINAAILAVAHSFRAQNYALGEDNPLGTLTIYGAIAQKFRGLVAILGTSGYVKAYSYDGRLKYQSPPRFLRSGRRGLADRDVGRADAGVRLERTVATTEPQRSRERRACTDPTI